MTAFIAFQAVAAAIAAIILFMDDEMQPWACRLAELVVASVCAGWSAFCLFALFAAYRP